MSDIKSIGLGDLLKSLVSRRTGLVKGPYAKVILWGLLGFLLFFAYVYFIFWPNLEQRQEMQRKVDAIPEMETKLKQLDFLNLKAEDDLHQAEKSYAELNQLFSVESELEELYQRLSMMASSQGMVISSLTKDGEEAIYPGAKQAPQGQSNATSVPVDPNAKNTNQGAPLFYRIKLKIELNGQYGRYMRYRKLLSEFDKSINIDKEQISLVPGDSRGLVVVKSQLSTYRLPNKLNTKTTPPASTSSTDLPVLRPANFDSDMGMRIIRVAGSTSADPLSSPANAGNITAPIARNRQTQILAGNAASPVEEFVSGNSVIVDGRGGSAQERDPFARTSNGMIEGGRDPRVSPLVMANPQAYVITGVIVSNSVKAAMVRTDFRENYVVKVGDRLGNQGGVITDIDLDGIVLKQANGKIRIYVQSQSGQSVSGSNSGAVR
ncbi:hypothetical protein [Polynucleobacter sp. AP-Kolm-20A-A1]|uniref:hypothetical protein n=1 Tax=Polynucleobacter sp. AP-Kolm-20A-A1 TaxID=2081041 RepID=UPI001BFEB9C2|nr:hypothetical protein [Polynucleobacter sp. AP-Kolm-20A-A1]QWE21461.1 hypothetical protein C2745_04590 [Polynucleobacter sp. AP-Kolm-20A-A1]